MRLLLLLSTLITIWKIGAAFSVKNCNNNGLPDAALLSQRSILMGSSQKISLSQINNNLTKRDTIKMPSQTPMVPWKASIISVERMRMKSP
jgi:hypothetical protein